jgi:hypothetical protein
MSYNVPGVNVVTTKLASGNVRFDFYDGNGPSGSSIGDLRFSVVMTSANVTAINTTVNGGSAGTTLTQGYAQDANQGDYVRGYLSVA